MFFVNDTPLEAVVVPNAEPGDEIKALVVVSITYAFAAGAPPSESLQLVRDQRPIVRGMDGPVLGDDCFVRWGVSVGATGFVHAPGGEAKRAEAKLQIGGAARAVAAFGPRVWQRGAVGLVPSSPLPFSSIAMSWDHAFGGTTKRQAQIVEIDKKDVFVPEYSDSYAMNPEGIGYYFEERHAENQPLPFLEDASQLVSRWNDRPEPLAFAPYAARGALRALSALDEKNRLDFNRSGRLTHRNAPRLVFEEVAKGTIVQLSGMRKNGEILAFEVPEPPASLEVALEAKTVPLDLALDAVDIDAVRGDVRLVYRKMFRYPLVEGELRVLRLVGTPRLEHDVKHMLREA